MATDPEQQQQAAGGDGQYAQTNAPAGGTPEQTTDGDADDAAPVDEPEQPDAGHVSSVTDLPEGAEVDPITDTPPAPLVEESAGTDG